VRHGIASDPCLCVHPAPSRRELPLALIKVHILQVYRTGFPDSQGGSEEVIRTLSRGLVARGEDVTVVFPSAQVRVAGEHMDQGVRVCRLPQSFEIASCNVSFRGIPAFRRLAAAADVLHYHFPWPWGDVLDLFSGAGSAPRVVTYHSDIVRQRLLAVPYAPLMHRFLGRADAVVATSPEYTLRSAVLRRHAASVRVIPIGIDAARIPLADPRRVQSWRARFGGDFFLFVGVLRYYKSLDVLIRAAVGARWQVVIAGEGPEGERLRQLARELGASNVHFTGYVPDADKWALLALAQAFVLPSALPAEAYGVSLLEAMCSGLPLVTSRIATGVDFVNREGETGLKVAPGDHGEMRVALDRLHADAPLRARLGEASRRRVLSDLQADTMVDAYRQLYWELLDVPH
jgi:glycosyltransferase involved in cell wall biosynthesis